MRWINDFGINNDRRYPMLYKRLFFMLIALCMCCFLVSCGNDDDDDDNNDDNAPPEGSQVGMRAVNFTLMDQSGNMISLHDFAGKIILLDFSSMWCGPCKTEASMAEALYQRSCGCPLTKTQADTSPGPTTLP